MYPQQQSPYSEQHTVLEIETLSFGYPVSLLMSLKLYVKCWTILIFHNFTENNGRISIYAQR